MPNITKKYDFLIVGAGFSGAVCAERLATNGYSVLLIDQRPHFGGNAFDQLDEYGVLVHPYGPHIFHTNSERILRYLSNFTDWKFYEHRVLADIDGKRLPIPINRTTINKLYNLDLTEKEVEQFLESKKIHIDQVNTSEDAVLSSVGEDLCDKFFRGYTKKQWSLDLSELSASVASRIPTRFNDDDRYFTDRYQLIPREGYTKLFSRMLENEKIETKLSTSFDQIQQNITWRHLIYTGPIDEYFDYKFGRLEYRSLRFEHSHYTDIEKYQEVGTINYPNEELKYTRVTEFKHITGQKCKGTSIVKEFPQADGDPYYPVPRKRNREIYSMYEELASIQSDVTFVGRLAEYRYYNMDQAVGSALSAVKKILEKIHKN